MRSSRMQREGISAFLEAPSAEVAGVRLAGGVGLGTVEAGTARGARRWAAASAEDQNVAHTRYARPDKKGTAHTRRQEGSPMAGPSVIFTSRTHSALRRITRLRDALFSADALCRHRLARCPSRFARSRVLSRAHRSARQPRRACDGFHRFRRARALVRL